jgi:hypothetical protein
LALVALSRTSSGGDLAVRVKRLEEEVERLRLALRAARQPEAAEPESAPAEVAVDLESAPVPDEAAAGQRSGPPPRPPQELPFEPRTPAPASARPSDGEQGSGASAGFARRGEGTGPLVERAGTGPLGAIDWERWLGVRGAAVLGGTALALAGLFFFRYSIEHGLIPPWLRVVLGVLTGVAALAGAEWTLRTRYAGTANALAGGGIVVLYAAFWAAGMLYELVPPGAVFVLMVVVTVAACLLSWRHESLVIAVIGLVGGFATPVFASTGSDRPIGLFGYLLMLDVGVLLLARRMRWPLLALLALAGTTLYELLWIGGRMGTERTLLGLGILAVFALAFVALSPRDTGGREERGWRWSQYGAVLLPLASALYFAGNADLDTGILPLGALLVVLGVAAGWLALRHDEGLLAVGAAAATLGVVLVWLAQNPSLDGTPWTACLVLVALAAAYHVALELAGDDGRATSRFVPLANAATVIALGSLVLLALVAATEPVSLWPLLAGSLGIAGVLVRQGTFAGRGWVQVAAAVGVACGLAGHRVGHGATLAATAARGVVVPVMLGAAVLWQGLALAQARLASWRAAEHAAATLALVLLLALAVDAPPSAAVGLGASLALGFLVLLAATRLAGGPWLVVATAATAFAHFVWTMERHPEPSGTGLALAGASCVLLVLWPFAAASRLRDDAWSWRASALAGLLWFPALLVLFEDRFGDAAIGVVPLALGAVAVGAAARARGLWPADDPRRTSALAWLCGVALAFVTAAIPLQVEKEWITIGWALEGAALVVLWTRLDHPGLKYTALALLGAVTVRLVANAEVLDYHPRPAWRILNWIAYAYLVPAAALVYAAKLLRPLELPRLRAWERRWYVREQPFAAALLGLAALVVVFVWINLAIADWFSPPGELRLLAARTPAEKLVISIAWALYAIALLALGVRLASGALRWASLALLMATIGKIFLYDVGELRDLYRVGALLGLALSLIVVSLVYQRFVFRRPAEGEP